VPINRLRFAAAFAAKKRETVHVPRQAAAACALYGRRRPLARELQTDHPYA
jgi:hypothetical protein